MAAALQVITVPVYFNSAQLLTPDGAPVTGQALQGVSAYGVTYITSSSAYMLHNHDENLDLISVTFGVDRNTIQGPIVDLFGGIAKIKYTSVAQPSVGQPPDDLDMNGILDEISLQRALKTAALATTENPYSTLGSPTSEKPVKGERNTILKDIIAPGTIMVDFHGESGHGRYYKKTTFNSFQLEGDPPRKRNPYTREIIKPEDVTIYIAKGGNRRQRKSRKARKAKRSTRKGRK